MKRLLLLSVATLALGIAVPELQDGSAAATIEPGSARFYTVLRGKARGAAQRTFIYERNFGGPGRHKRRFYLRGQDSYTVKSADGSLLTAFQATLNSADGTGDIVLFFRDLHFLGWASNRLTINLGLGRRGDAILVRYAVYRGRDAFCCPSGVRPVTYRWDGLRVRRIGKPPLIYGKPGPRLHFGRHRR
jgi:hypothetical protein